MLTTEAFNALLKTLEEPPAHVKFIFATTDPNKLPLTVASRCQRCDFKRIPLELLVKNLRDIAQKEGFNVEEEALFSVAKAAQGSMRDALSVLDQLISYSDGEVKAADVNEMLGLVEFQYLLDLAEAVAAKDCSRAFEVLDALISRGKDVKQLTMNLIEHFRHLMVMKVGGDKLQSLVDHPKLQKEAIYRQAGRFTMHEIIHALEILVDAQDTARVTESARLALELALAQTMAAEIPSSASPRNIKAASETSSTLAGSRPAEPPSPASFKTVAKPAGQPTAQKNPLRAVPVEEPPASGFIKNNKGQIGVVSSAAVPEAVDAPKAEILEIDNIKRQWNALTHAVAQEKISTGTFLQEGYPLKVSGNIISVAFTREHAFHKECLAKHEVRDLVVKVFSAFLGIGVTVELVLVDGPLTRLSEEITEAREIFNGEIVNEWHSDE
jgi:DNA polymerase-3 subunit gamma/tau